MVLRAARRQADGLTREGRIREGGRSRFVGWAVLVVVAIAPTRASLPEDEAKPAATFVEPVAFGPAFASDPWVATFSPDGRWVGLVDGYAPAVEIWEVATGERRLARKLGGYGHAFVFAKDARRAFTVEMRHLLVATLAEDGWSVEKRIPLGIDTSVGGALAPHSLDVAPDGRRVLLVESGLVHEVDLRKETVRALPALGKDVLRLRFLADGALALSRTEAFATTVVPTEGVIRSVPGLLLAESPDGLLWLVASDRERSDLGIRHDHRISRLALEVREARTGEVQGATVLEGRRQENEPHSKALLCHATFSPDGRWLAVAENPDGFAVRDARTLRIVQRIAQFRSYALAAAFDPRGTWLLTGGRRSDERNAPGVLLWRHRASPSGG
jgi:hypothetical protein